MIVGMRTFDQTQETFALETNQKVVKSATDLPAEVIRSSCCLRLAAPLGLAGMLFFFHDATRGISSFHP